MHQDGQTDDIERRKPRTDSERPKPVVPERQKSVDSECQQSVKTERKMSVDSERQNSVDSLPIFKYMTSSAGRAYYSGCIREILAGSWLEVVTNPTPSDSRANSTLVSECKVSAGIAPVRRRWYMCARDSKRVLWAQAVFVSLLALGLMVGLTCSLYVDPPTQGQNASSSAPSWMSSTAALGTLTIVTTKNSSTLSTVPPTEFMKTSTTTLSLAAIKSATIVAPTAVIPTVPESSSATATSTHSTKPSTTHPTTQPTTLPSIESTRLSPIHSEKPPMAPSPAQPTTHSATPTSKTESRPRPGDGIDIGRVFAATFSLPLNDCTDPCHLGLSRNEYTAGVSQNLYGDDAADIPGWSCGTCWRLNAERDVNNNPIEHASSIVVRLKTVCPREPGNDLCLQKDLTPDSTNVHGAVVNFNLCPESGAVRAMFGDSGVQFGIGKATRVVCP